MSNYNANIETMLTGMIVNGDPVGIRFDTLGDQEAISVVDDLGNKYSLEFTPDGGKLYNTADPYSGGIGSPQTAKVDNYTTETGNSYITNMLKINSFFVGGGVGSNDIPAASHCYVELTNCLRSSISLNSVMLMYLDNSTTTWKCLKLKGHIPAHGSYIIRGAACTVEGVEPIDSNETFNIKEYDMEWTDENGNLVSFNGEKGATFYLCQHENGTVWGKSQSGSQWVDVDYKDSSEFQTTSPYNTATGSEPKGYIDLVGVAPYGNNALAESNAIVLKKGEKPHRCIFHRMYPQDTCSKVNKAWTSRKTTTFFTYCNMDVMHKDSFPYWTPYLKDKLRPKASYEHKKFNDDKSACDPNKPNCINQTFGIQGSATSLSSADATRIFTWVSVGYYNEYLEYRTQGASEWTRLYSIDKNDYTMTDGTHYGHFANGTDAQKTCYNRVKYFIDVYSRWRWASVSGKMNVTHRVIIPGLNAGTYEYRVGRDGNAAYTSEVRKFIIKANPSSFTFVQHTDQQDYGFVGYAAWMKSAYAIAKNNWGTSAPLDFTINTGDMSQNGNRENEWIDYYNAKLALQDIPEMPCIGNNDLGSSSFATLNDDASSGTAKINSMTIWAWYTFEFDVDNPPYFKFKPSSYNATEVGPWVMKDESGVLTYFIPSVYSYNYGAYHFIVLNSEFATNSGVYAMYYNNSDIETAFQRASYYNIYKWLTVDDAKYSSMKKIAYMHEIPFCISPTTTTQGCPAERKTSNSGMSKLNFDFSAYLEYAPARDCDSRFSSDKAKMYENGACFSEFFQIHGIQLVLGGHKHTYSLSHPIFENVIYNYTTPAGVSNTTHVRTTALAAGNTITSRIVEANKPIIYKDNKYITRQVNSNYNDYDVTDVTSDWAAAIASQYKPVTYCMSQATGYKLSSNNDKPGSWVNWLKDWFPYNETAKVVNAGQTWSMCNGFMCTSSAINMTSYQVVGVTAATAGFASPKLFNINDQCNMNDSGHTEPYLSTFKSVNGFGSEGNTCGSTISM